MKWTNSKNYQSLLREVNNLNSPIPVKEVEFIVKYLPQKIQSHMSLPNPTKYLRDNTKSIQTPTRN